ncbi:MAG TPA: GntR family transcriptional regulator [bacterium]
MASSNELRTDIQFGRLAPGAVLQQEQLAKRFAVSRQPIRMALEILKASGWVMSRRDRSVEVSGLSPQALHDLLQVRATVEREALTAAIPLLSGKDLLEAKHLQERIEVETDPKALEELDCAFHTALYRACGNARLLALIDELRRENLRPYREQPPKSQQRAGWGEDHAKLLAACRARDVAAAVAQLQAHIFHAEASSDGR